MISKISAGESISKVGMGEDVMNEVKPEMSTSYVGEHDSL